MGYDRVGFVRDSIASVHATVSNCLVGVPNAMISGRKICVHGVEDEMSGNARAVMLHYAVYLGVHTCRKYMSMHVQQPVRYYYYSVPWYSKHRERVHVHT